MPEEIRQVKNWAIITCRKILLYKKEKVILHYCMSPLNGKQHNEKTDLVQKLNTQPWE